MGLLLFAFLCVNSRVVLAQQGAVFPDLGKGLGPSKAEVVGAIVGAAALIGIVVYLVIPKQKTIEGCVVSGDGGLQLTGDKDKRIYVLGTRRVSLQPGQRVTLKGKAGKRNRGTRDFAVNKLVKDEGTCSGHADLLLPAPVQRATLDTP